MHPYMHPYMLGSEFVSDFNWTAFTALGVLALALLVAAGWWTTRIAHRDEPTETEHPVSSLPNEIADLDQRVHRLEQRLIAPDSGERVAAPGPHSDHLHSDAPVIRNMHLDLSPAVEDTLAEMRRQVDQLNWTPEHDDLHGVGEWTALILGRLARFADHETRMGRRRKYLIVIAALALKACESLDRMYPQLRGQEDA